MFFYLYIAIALCVCTHSNLVSSADAIIKVTPVVLSRNHVTYELTKWGIWGDIKKLRVWLGDTQIAYITYDNGMTGDYPSIDEVYVVPDYRRQGLAHDIMKKALSNIHKINPKEDIYLKAQPIFDKPMQLDSLVGFYQKYGAVIVPQANSYYVKMKITPQGD